jgi:hypothetical protein
MTDKLYHVRPHRLDHQPAASTGDQRTAQERRESQTEAQIWKRDREEAQAWHDHKAFCRGVEKVFT